MPYFGVTFRPPGLYLGPFWFSFEFQPRDLWVGVYVNRSYWEFGACVHKLHVILPPFGLPMLPLRIVYLKRRKL